LYLSDVLNEEANSNNIHLSQINQKVIFNSNPIVTVDPIQDQEVVTKKYLFKIFENIFGKSFYENSLSTVSPVSIYNISVSNAECIEGEDLIFELIISPQLIANLRLQLDIISSTAIASVDFTNNFFYSSDNIEFIEIQDNVINIDAGINIVYVKIKTMVRDDTSFYGDKILILKVDEILLYDSPEDPYFMFNDIGIGKIKEYRSKPKVYNLSISNPIQYRGNDIIFELTVDSIISNLDLYYNFANLTAFSEVDYDTIDLSYSIDNGTTWESSQINLLTLKNTDKLLLKVRTFEAFEYKGDKVFLLNILNASNAPENSIVNIVNSVSYATIRDTILPTVESYLIVRDAICNEGDDLIFETELTISDSDINNINETSQIIVYFDIKNITAFSGIDFSEVMYWSVDNINYIATSSRQVIYTKSNLKIYIKFKTINSAAQEYNYNITRSLLLKPEFIINKPSNVNIKISDIGVGTINNITTPFENYVFNIEDSTAIEGDYIVFDIFSDKPVTDDVVLNIKSSNITAIETLDYLNDSLQYSINQGSTWINATYSNIIFSKDLTNIKIRYYTIRRSDYTGPRSLLVKIKSIVTKPNYFNIDYQDMGIGTILDMEDPPTNYEIILVDKDYSVKHGNDFIFECYIYPPLKYDNLELKLNIISDPEDLDGNNKAILNSDYSLRFGSFSTNNGISWSSISQADTIVLHKNVTYFKIKIPTYYNVSKLNIKNIKFLIEAVVFNIPNSNINIKDAFVLTQITV
jgi:hypothetical protein